MIAQRPASRRRTPRSIPDCALFLFLLLLSGSLCMRAATQRSRTSHAPATHHHGTSSQSSTRRSTSGRSTHSSPRGGGHDIGSGHSRSTIHSYAAAPARRGKTKSHGRAVVHEAINPTARLDTISNLSYSLAHGSSALNHTSALESFFDALAAHQAEPSGPTLRVLQFGDSHTAADMFTGEARRVFQGQFGNGGIGFSYPGHPFAGYRIFGSQRGQSSGWTTLGTHFVDLGDAELGMGGIAINTFSPGQSISLDTPCASFELEFLKQPGGGALQVTDNGASVGEVETAGEVPEGGAFTYDCPASTGYEDHHFVVTTENHAPVRLLGTTTLQPGVTWEALGINGAQAPLVLEWNQPIFSSYLSKTGATMVVLAYGTNEAAAAHWTTESYSETFTQIVEKIHTALPNAAILVLGPADRSVAARRRGFAPFTGTERIIEAQREVCRTHGCAFWDTQKRMGGFGSMQRWVYAGWAQHDHTHMNAEGYRVLADALMADLLSGYDSYRAAHGLAVSPSLRGTTARPAPATNEPATGTPATNMPAANMPAANAPALPPTPPTTLPQNQIQPH
ncbi:MAG TPA: GDSL-type esterase/lipase family protein [Acidobacteriaceae bacterium]